MINSYTDETTLTYSCKYCGEQISDTGNPFRNYFNNKHPKGEKCGEAMNLFRSYSSNYLTPLYFNPSVTSLLKIYTSHFTINLNCDDIAELKFSDYGVPENAKILQLNYTPTLKYDATILPVEMHSNSPSIYKYRNGTVQIKGIHMGNNKSVDNCDINVSVWWSNYVDDKLIEAFVSFDNNTLIDCIIPANVSVEARLREFIFHEIKTAEINGEILDLKFNKKTPYKKVLNNIFPTILKKCKLQFYSFPSELYDSLNELRRLRNESGHTGKLEKPLTEKKCYELIMSALFTNLFLDFLE